MIYIFKIGTGFEQLIPVICELLDILDTGFWAHHSILCNN